MDEVDASHTSTTVTASGAVDVETLAADSKVSVAWSDNFLFLKAKSNRAWERSSLLLSSMIVFHSGAITVK